MRLTLIDLLIADLLVLIGVALGIVLSAALHSLPPLIAACSGAIALYLLAIGPIYKWLHYPPMVLPRCPCCHKPQRGFHITGAWPRITYRCPTCHGEFIIYLTGKPAPDEPWDKPVLAPKWPYPIAGYKRIKKPDQAATDH